MSDLRYPLSWPASWPRTRFPKASRFNGTRSFAAARDELLRQLSLLGATSVVLSSNVPLRQDGLPRSGVRAPEDRGVAVYFQLKKSPMVLACDAWDKVQDNVWAIACHAKAIRDQQRWGVGTVEQAFMGYTALPEAAAPDAWWVVLGLSPTATMDEIKDAYRRAAKSAHPDAGGDRALWDEIQDAYEKGCLERTPVH